MWHPHKTVATVVERDGHFLMVQERSDGEVVFNQPAGHLEPGESLIDAAIRETREETRWSVTIDSFLGLYHYNSSSNNICYIRSCFVASALAENTDLPLDKDIIAAHWLTYEEIKSLQPQLRSPVVLKVVEDYLAGQTFPLSLLTTSISQA